MGYKQKKLRKRLEAMLEELEEILYDNSVGEDYKKFLYQEIIRLTEELGLDTSEIPRLGGKNEA